MKNLIVYFTQGGTTAKGAEAIAAGLRSKGHEVDLHNMNDGVPPRLDGYGSLGIGLPVYYWRAPFKVIDYVKSLPDLKGLPVFVFLLYASNHAHAGNWVRKTLARKGGREVGYFKAQGADYTYGYIKRGYLFSPNNPTALELDAAQDLGRSVADRIAGKLDYVKPGYDRLPSLEYYIQHLLTSRWLVKSIYSRLFFLTSNKCTSCGLCMKVCPTKNITANAKGHPVWGRNCLLCLYCEMKCPTEAILSPVSLPIFAPCMAYNIWRDRNNPSLEFVRVVHEKGQTKVVRAPPLF